MNPAPRAQHGRDHRLVIGAMTGTSVDGIDLALVEIRGRGPTMRAALLRGHGASLGGLAPRLRAAAAQEPLTAADFAALAQDLGELHAREIEALADGAAIDLVAVHGQTIVHAPPLSWQIIDLAPIASRLRCRVIGDLRKADLAAGGQGAPLTPLADWILYRAETPRVILNLGGFANATLLPADPGDDVRGPDDLATELAARRAIDAIRGADLCVCNQLLDAAARRVLGRPFDEEGAAARRGRVDPAVSDALAARLERQGAAHRSLGTGDEHLDWLDGAATSLAAEDLLATLAAAIGRATARGIAALAGASAPPPCVIAAGGGTRNAALMNALSRELGSALRRSDDVGIPASLREAACWAVLGALADDGVPVSLPQVTGRGAPRVRDGVVFEGLGAAPAPPSARS